MGWARSAWPIFTDLDKAKALVAEAGFPQGVDTTLPLDIGTSTVGEPTAVLIAESLAASRTTGRVGQGVSCLRRAQVSFGSWFTHAQELAR